MKLFNSINIQTTNSLKYIFPITRLFVMVFLFLVYFLFKTPLDQYFEKFLVSPFFPYLNKGLWTDIAFTLLIVSFFVAVAKNFISLKNFFRELSIFVFISILLLFNRYSGNWEYLDFHCWSGFYYIDVLVITCGLLVLFSAIRIVRSDKPQNPKGSGKLKIVQDLPLKYDSLQEFKEKDVLGYYDYAIHLANVLKSSSFEQAFGLGVTGEWGTGKTTFVEIMIKKLQETHTVVVFDPWLRPDSRSIVQDFFANLYDNLPYRLRYSRSSFMEYASAVANVSGNGWFSRLSYTSNSELGDFYKDIGERFGRMNKHIVVFIDDLDRLDGSEVVTLFKLIRNTASFPNLVYVSAYDQDYIKELLNKRAINNPSQYLKKIFQLEINLPAFDRARLSSVFLEVANKNILNRNSDLLKDSLKPKSNAAFNYSADMFKKLVHDAKVNDLFTHATLSDLFYFYVYDIRDVVRFANSFSFNIARVEKNLLVEEFFALELFRFSYPKLYDIFYENHNDVLKQEGRNNSYYSLKHLCADFIFGDEENYDESNDASKSISPFFKYMWNSVEVVNRYKIFALLDFLFRNRMPSEDYRNAFSIRHVSRFDLYFRFYLLKSDLDFGKIECYRQMCSFEDTRSYIDENIENDKTIKPLVEYFYLTNPRVNDISDGKYLVECVCYLNELSYLTQVSLIQYPQVDVGDKIIAFLEMCSNHDDFFSLLDIIFSRIDNKRIPLDILSITFWNGNEVDLHKLNPIRVAKLLKQLLMDFLYSCEDYNQARSAVYNTFNLFIESGKLDSHKKILVDEMRSLLSKDICLLFNLFIVKVEGVTVNYNFNKTLFRFIFSDLDMLKEIVFFDNLNATDKLAIEELGEFYNSLGDEFNGDFTFKNVCINRL